MGIRGQERNGRLDSQPTFPKVGREMGTQFLQITVLLHNIIVKYISIKKEQSLQVTATKKGTEVRNEKEALGRSDLPGQHRFQLV